MDFCAGNDCAAVNFKACIGCGDCVAICPTEAMHLEKKKCR